MLQGFVYTFHGVANLPETKADRYRAESTEVPGVPVSF